MAKIWFCFILFSIFLLEILSYTFPVHDKYDTFLFRGHAAEKLGFSRDKTYEALDPIPELNKWRPKRLGEWLVNKFGSENTTLFFNKIVEETKTFENKKNEMLSKQPEAVQEAWKQIEEFLTKIKKKQTCTSAAVRKMRDIKNNLNENDKQSYEKFVNDLYGYQPLE
uniref:SXP/RAL-2 family protein Ani s 5-like cation-binding domain-containing protein n=1 Tax=Panagrolaimus sp. JU765 TaxID=591449 RepID=A0AC34QSQ0_9BILA